MVATTAELYGIPTMPLSAVGQEMVTGETYPKSIVKSTDDLYEALLKLDDLRKKGILTDEEFQAEKKKVLSRSN